MIECPVCKTQANSYEPGTGNSRFDCPRCGEYDLTGSLVASIQHQLDGGIHRRALMSHVIRRIERTKNKPPLISTYDVDRLLLTERLPTPQKQADDLIVWVGDNQLYPDEFQRCALPFISAWVGTSLNPTEPGSGGIHWLSDYLATVELLETQIESPSMWQFRLTMPGWGKYAELKQTGVSTSQAFVAMWFDDCTEEAWQDGLRKGIAASGYDPLRINMKEHVNKICDEIIAEIRRSRFVVADYTGHRGGVYYEAGFAAGRGLTVIPTCRKDEMNQLHFDVRQYNCIDWQTPAELAERLQARIEAVLGDGPHKNSNA
jgi:hypothetical protein